MGNQFVEVTAEYTLFKGVLGNRDIVDVHLQYLIKEIEKDNQLHLHPILVDSAYNIIDGQHRLEVAKILGVPIYYIKDDDVSIDHIISSNANQRSWKPNDYIKFFALYKKNSNYAKFYELMSTLKISAQTLKHLINGSENSYHAKEFKLGKFIFPNDLLTLAVLHNFIKFVEFCSERKVGPRSLIRHKYMALAFRILHEHPNFNFNTFMDKLTYKWHLIRHHGSLDQFLETFVEIYNWKSHKKIEFSRDRKNTNFVATTYESDNPALSA